MRQPSKNPASRPAEERTPGASAIPRLLWRGGLAAALLAWLFTARPLDWADVAHALRAAGARPGMLALGVALAGAALLVGAWRWHLLLRATGMKVGRGRATRWYFIGQFYNAFLPGACGGDVARAWLATRAAPERRTAAALTVIAERGLGLLVYILFAAAALGIRRTASPLPLALRLAPHALAAAGLAAATLAWRWSHASPRETVATAGWWRTHLDNVHAALPIYRQPGVLWPTVLLSLLNLAGLTLSGWCLARALNLPLTPADAFTFLPLLAVLSAIPLTPGALGLREGLFVVALSPLGIPPAGALALSLLIFADGLFWSAIGAFCRP